MKLGVSQVVIDGKPYILSGYRPDLNDGCKTKIELIDKTGKSLLVESLLLNCVQILPRIVEDGPTFSQELVSLVRQNRIDILVKSRKEKKKKALSLRKPMVPKSKQIFDAFKSKGLSDEMITTIMRGMGLDVPKA
jgi:hypothetical protein